MTIGDETLFAYLDGTLPPDEQRRIALAIAEDPALAERVERQAELAEAARDSFAADLDEPIPDAWIAAIDAAMPQAQTGQVASLAAARERKRARWTSWQAGGAIAAALVLGLFLGNGAGGPGGDLVVEQGGALMAAAEVGEALDGARSGVAVQLAGGRSLDVQLSLKTPQGGFCREALLSAPGGSDRMLACREDQGWRIAGLAHEAAGGTGYETVGGEGALDGLVDSLGGEPLDAAAEQAAIQRGWKR